MTSETILPPSVGSIRETTPPAPSSTITTDLRACMVLQVLVTRTPLGRGRGAFQRRTDGLLLLDELNSDDSTGSQSGVPVHVVVRGVGDHVSRKGRIDCRGGLGDLP